jgi:hypothetical protein
MYVFKYPERREGPSSEVWSIRQTGVYSRLRHLDSSASWVILHPLYESRSEEALQNALQHTTTRHDLIDQPVDQHLLLINTYFSNWREYMLHFEEDILAMVSKRIAK